MKDGSFFALNLKMVNGDKYLVVIESTSSNMFFKKVWVHGYEESRFATTMNIYPQQWFFKRLGNTGFAIAFAESSFGLAI